MTTGAGVFCVVCDARPYPELGPPDTREEFDLMGLDCKGCRPRAQHQVSGLFVAFQAQWLPRLSGQRRSDE